MMDFWIFWLLFVALTWMIVLAEHVSEILRRRRECARQIVRAKRERLHRDQANWRVDEATHPPVIPMPSPRSPRRRHVGAVRRPLYYAIRSLDAPRLEMGQTFDLDRTVHEAQAEHIIEILTFTTRRGISEWLEQRLAEVGGDIEKLQDQRPPWEEAG